VQWRCRHRERGETLDSLYGKGGKGEKEGKKAKGSDNVRRAQSEGEKSNVGRMKLRPISGERRKGKKEEKEKFGVSKNGPSSATTKKGG